MRTILFSPTFIILSFLLGIKGNAQTSCIITCPEHITVTGTSASGAVVNYGTITNSGDCGIITSLPASGSTFPIGTTTVNVYKNAGQLVYALKANTLITFSISDPSVVSSPLVITGLQAGESIRSIDFRVTDGKLFALGAVSISGNWVGRIYTINTTTGVATQVGSGTFPLGAVAFLSSLNASIDIDPTADMIRLVTDEDLNMRISPNNGAYTVDGVIDPTGRSVSGIAYSNNIPSATSTILYDIGFGTQIPIAANTFYIQDPNKGTLEEIGLTSIGAFSHSFGFDISQTGDALASASRSTGTFPNIQQEPTLFRINLQTGIATNIGTIGTTVEDISIAPVILTEPSCSFTVTVTPPPPTVTINKSVGQPDPAINIPVRFTVEFSEEVTGFDASDISFAGSTAPGTLAATITGTGPTYTVAVTGMTGAGDVVASIPAGAATNANGLTSLASTSTDNVIGLLVFENEFVITKNASQFVNAGDLITYFINVIRIPIAGTNPQPPYQNVEVTDILPAGTTFVGIIPQQFNTNLPIIIPPPVNTNGTVRLLFPNFIAGQNFSFLLQVRVAPETTGTISNTATVAGPLGDVNPANNSATANVQVSVPPTITCPQNIVVNTEEGLCRAEILFTDENEIKVTATPAAKISYKITNTSGGSSFGSNLDAFPSSLQFPIGVHTVEVTATNSAGSQSCSFTVTVNDNQAPVITCPSNITVNSTAGKCSADVTFTFNVQDICSTIDLPVSVAISTGVTVTFSSSTLFTFTTTGTFPVGINSCTLTATDAYGNTSTCSFTVTVLDKEKPVITLKPADVTVECASQIPAVNISSVTATDNCGTSTITHVSDVISNQTCANKYTITRTYQAADGSGNTETAVQLITVDDKTAPTITGLTPSKRILAPPNHKMVDITLAYNINDNCVSSPNVTINISSNEPVNGTGDGDTDPDWEVVDDHHIRLRAERSALGTGRIYTITVTVSDGCNAAVSASTEVRVAHNITSPHSGNSFKVGSTVAFTGEFWDVPGNKHTAKWLIDGTSVSGVVTEPVGAKNGKVNGSYKFTTPGVYKLQMNVTDQKGVTTYANTNGDLEAIVVIYDPNGGYTYGGGYYNSPAGALTANPSSTGKASYGFAMNYFKNSTNPKGETQFEFKVGEFEFNALNFEYLVISNSMAQFKGTGKIIGGQSGVAFTMTVVDGQLDGTGIDKIRMKIYNKNNGKVIYDNQPGASDAALPTAAVGTNSIIVISGNYVNTIIAKMASGQVENERLSVKVFDELTATVYPNPASNYFNIVINSNDNKEKIVLQVSDQFGRVIEVKNNVANGSVVRLGDLYRSGVYYVKVIQGKQHKELKLVKLN